MMQKRSIKDARGDFPMMDRQVHGDKRLVYLDNASTTQKPLQVIDTLTKYYKNYNANIHRAVYVIATEATTAYEVREKTAKFIGAKNHDEMFASSACQCLHLNMSINAGVFHDLLHANFWQSIAAPNPITSAMFGVPASNLYGTSFHVVSCLYLTYHIASSMKRCHVSRKMLFLPILHSSWSKHLVT